MEYLECLLGNSIQREAIPGLKTKIAEHHRLLEIYLQEERRSSKEKHDRSTKTNKGNLCGLIMVFVLVFIWYVVFIFCLVDAMHSHVGIFKSSRFDFKPKHHYVLHMPDMCLDWGPPRGYWCMRFESRHQEVKLVVNHSNWISVMKQIISRCNYAQQRRLLPLRHSLSAGKPVLSFPTPFKTGIRYRLSAKR